jgi:hypothetical protein
MNQPPQEMAMNRIRMLTLNVLLPAPPAGLGCCLRRLFSPRLVACLIAAVAIQTATAEEPERNFLDFVRARAAELRARDEAPPSLEEWQKRRGGIRRQMLKAWGEFPKKPSPLNPQILTSAVYGLTALPPNRARLDVES